MKEFVPFNKIVRLSREMIVTEKIDGTNSSVFIGEDGEFLTASRKRWITPEDDNYGFSKWAHEHKDELMLLGSGYHFGEWWGCGIRRSYGIDEKRWSLFNVGVWNADNIPSCCHIVPVLYNGLFDTNKIQEILNDLAINGSVAAPGFMRPEGVVIFHVAARMLFKKTILKDESPKGYAEE